MSSNFNDITVMYKSSKDDKRDCYVCALLINPSYSIKTISEQTGFGDEKYMAKCIKKETGMTPSQYRKSKLIQ